MSNRIKDIIQFLKIDIWHVGRQDVSPVRYFVYDIIKKIILTAERFTTKRTTDASAALTYSTLLAIVPILAVIFAVARGFGYNKYIETWFRDMLSSQPQAAEVIIGFVNSYLVHTKSGIFLGVGLVFMLWTVIMLINNVENAFNNIWQVTKSRNLYRSVIDYMAMILLVPIVIVITSGVSILMATVVDDIDTYFLLGPMMRFILNLMPYVIMSAVFIGLYIFMPNTNVRLRSAIVPGILAGVAMQGLQFFYIHSQIWVSSYNAIYGSFAALPLFILWVQISWTICLLGGELCYTNQNLEDFAFRVSTEELSHHYKMILCTMIMAMVCRRFDQGLRPYTALEIKTKTGIPIRIVHDLLFFLTRLNLLSEVNTDDRTGLVFQPAMSTENLSVGMLIDRLETEGKCRLDVNKKLLDSDLWNKACEQRAKYIEQQRDILLKDL